MRMAFEIDLDTFTEFEKSIEFEFEGKEILKSNWKLYIYKYRIFSSLSQRRDRELIADQEITGVGLACVKLTIKTNFS